MRTVFRLLSLIGLMVAATAFAQAPAGAPAGTTGLCKDGTYTSSATKKGACTGHKGVKDWYATAETSKAAAAASSPAPAAAKTATPASPPPATAKAAAPTKTTSTQTAPGGGAGQVWVNTESKVYHCPGNKYYGKTKHGEYMTEEAAKAAGNRPDHGKACKS